MSIFGISSKHNHCRCSKLCPVIIEYDRFVATWLSILVLFVIFMMAIPIVKDKNFRRQFVCYINLIKCHTLCLWDRLSALLNNSRRPAITNKSKAPKGGKQPKQKQPAPKKK